MATQITMNSLVIGLDFGTTFSGVAWALGDGQKQVEAVSTWPGGGNRTSVKIPTIMTYSDDRLLWGWQALSSSQELIRGVKLLLDDSQSSRYAPSLRAKKMLAFMGKDPVEVAGDYLEKLIRHCHDVLERRFGPSVNGMSKKYVLTVPAVWSDKAKDATMKIAIKAGLPEAQVSLLSEPEAAALYTLKAIQPNTIKKDETFLVCDAGGGTVDLISYRVNDLSPLDLEEVVEGTGGVCGSMILDDRFERFLEETLGFDAFELLPERTRTGAIRYWETTIKPQYLGTEIENEDDYGDIDWELPLPGIPDKPLIGLEGGYMQLTKSQVQGIFDPVVQEVINLVQAQVRKIKVAGLPIHAILLVGGFGGSEYLYRRLRKANPRITVMQPPDAWQAVVCGAVLRGLDGNQVSSRLARGHYGVEVEIDYDPNLHSHLEPRWCNIERKYKACNQLDWFIKKGTSISENNPVRNRFYRTVLCDELDWLVFEEVLYFSTMEPAPYEMSNKVSKLCSFKVDLRAVPKQLFKRRTNDMGVSYYKIKFDLAIIPTSGYMYFQHEFDGTSYGSVQADY